MLHVSRSCSWDGVVVAMSLSSISYSETEDDTVDDVSALLVEAFRIFGERMSVAWF